MSEAAGVLGALGLAALATVLARRKVRRDENTPVNVLVRALGHDPGKVVVVRVRKPKPGIRILSLDGKPVAYYTAAQLKRKRKDAAFLLRWKAARAG